MLSFAWNVVRVGKMLQTRLASAKIVPSLKVECPLNLKSQDIYYFSGKLLKDICFNDLNVRAFSVKSFVILIALT